MRLSTAIQAPAADDGKAGGSSVETAAARILHSLEGRQKQVNKKPAAKRPAAEIAPAEDVPLKCPISTQNMRPALPLKHNGFTIYTDVPGKRFKIKDSRGVVSSMAWVQRGLEDAWRAVAALVSKRALCWSRLYSGWQRDWRKSLGNKCDSMSAVASI